MTENVIAGPHGASIVYDTYAARMRPRAIVQLLHGRDGHAGLYRDLCETLAEAGYTTYAADLAGHGRTGLREFGGDRTRLGIVGPGGGNRAREQIRALAKLIVREHPGRPIVLLGDSWGSLLAQQVVNKSADTYSALVLAATAYRMPGWINGDLNRDWAGPGATGGEFLSRDPAVFERFTSDPLSAHEDHPFSLIEGLQVLGRPRRRLGKSLPILMLVGECDSLGGPRSVRRLASAYRERSRLDDVTVLEYADARHAILNEVNHAEVRADLISWLDARFESDG